MKHVRISMLVVAVILCTTAGCDDKGNDPRPIQYRLIAGPSVPQGDAQNRWVYLFDVKTDSAVDSVGCPEGAGYPYGTRGAPYVAVWCRESECFRILDTRSLSEITVNCTLHDVYFDIEHDLIVGFRAIYEGGPYLAEAVIADLHSGQIERIDTILTKAEIDSLGISHQVIEVIHPETGMAYGVVGYEGTFHTDIFAYDYLGARLRKIWHIESDELNGEIPVSSRMFEIHPDGRRVYFVPLAWPDLFCFNLETEEILFRVPAPPGFQRIARVDPSGTNVYVLAQGTVSGPPVYRRVSVYDATNGGLIAEIPIDSTALPDSLVPLYPNDIAFVPGSGKAYLASGLAPGGIKGRGKIIVLDVDERRATGALSYRFSFTGPPGQIWVLPLP